MLLLLARRTYPRDVATALASENAAAPAASGPGLQDTNQSKEHP